MCTSQHAFKYTLQCAHIPLNVVSRGAQLAVHPESLGRGRYSLAKKTLGGVGVRDEMKGESSLSVKDQPSV